jgi:hypothetical protein
MYTVFWFNKQNELEKFHIQAQNISHLSLVSLITPSVETVSLKKTKAENFKELFF